MSIVDDHGVSNRSTNQTFSEIIEARLSRRGVLKGGIAALAGGVAFSGVDALMRAVPSAQAQPGSAGWGDDVALLGFKGLAVSTEDTVTVPAGYSATTLISWGDPVSDGPAFAPDASNSAADQAQQWGMHNDGMVYFPLRGIGRGLLVVNSEYTDDGLLFADGVADWTAEKTAKSLNAHGVNIIEVSRRRKQWSVVRPSRYARRITGSTEMTMSGPAAGHSLLQTSADPTGTAVLGTLNNCSMGRTPWGTYLACEENFNGYFRKTAEPNELEDRYGIDADGFGYLWHETDIRFQVDAEANEPNRFGWVVEIDPFRVDSVPAKRTALGRLKHEGAKVQQANDGRVVVYMGDDERFEYIYRYVSRQSWRTARKQGIDPLDDGSLYVATFNAGGTGQWTELSPAHPALSTWTQAEILIKTRLAADAVGATKMDRAEWIDTIPGAKTVLCTLTNNSRRGTGENPPVDPANPRPSNVYGHIIQWHYAEDFTDESFAWDIFAQGGDPEVPAHGSTINGDSYGSPDGLYVAPSGRLWIQTDVSTSTVNAGAYAGFGNNQMLCADPTTGETRRFLVGPKQCEVTGVWLTPGERTMFVGIQHPGERPDDLPGDPINPKEFGSWPEGDAGGRPRSSVVVITKDDGGVIGS
jgi:uncharacterized protein